MNVLISIIVPIYKVEPYLMRFFDCIESQTDKEFEVIFVDDGSPDDCGLICDSYAESAKNTRVIHKPNGGVSSARNEGIRHAIGDWILFFDPDDIFVPSTIATLIKSIEAFPSVDWIIFNHEFVPLKGTAVKSDHGVPTDVILDGQDIVKHIYSAVLRKENVLRSPWTKAYRRSLLIENNIFFTDRTFAEDYEFNLKYIKVINSALAINDCLYGYCAHLESAIARYHKHAIDIWLKDTETELSIISTLGKETLDLYGTNMYVQQKFSSLAYFIVAEQKKNKEFKKSICHFFDNEIIDKLNALNPHAINQPWQLFRQAIIAKTYWKVYFVTWLTRQRINLQNLIKRIK